MAEINCVLIVEDDEHAITLDTTVPGSALITAIVSNLDLPTANQRERYIYTLRHPVSRVQLLAGEETLADAGNR